MRNSNSHKTVRFDLGIIGGGLSALVLLRTLTGALPENSPRPIRILLVDKNPIEQLGRGLPYATPSAGYSENSGSRAELLNSPASRMGLESVLDENANFVRWLQENETQWLALLGLQRTASDKFEQLPAGETWSAWEAPAISRWLAFNLDKLEARSYETAYFPRCVYGDFITALARETLRLVSDTGIDLQHLRGQIVAMETPAIAQGPFHLTLLENGTKGAVTVDKLVYTAGDMPPAPLGPADITSRRIVELPYGTDPGRTERHALLLESLQRDKAKGVSLVLAGGNASALDQLWTLYNDPQLNRALQERRLKVSLVTPAPLPHPGTVLLPATGVTHADPLRWMTERQQALLDTVISRYLNPQLEYTGASYKAAVASALGELQLDSQPHLFMVFLRRLGEVEQTIRDKLPDITEFANAHHAALEELLLFTPCEYWQVMQALVEQYQVLESVSARVLGVEPLSNETLQVTLDNGAVLPCAMFINCTGPQHPFSPGAENHLLRQLVTQQVAIDNGSGGLRTSTEGLLQISDTAYSKAAYLCTQGSQGLQRPAAGGKTRFISANRLTAVRVAEQAKRIALDLAVTLV